MILDFKKHYYDVLRGEMMEKMGYKSILEVPRLEKIVINMGLGRRGQDKAFLQAAQEGLADIAGQMPCKTYARQSIAGFKLREGMTLGLKVTLRKTRMYEFLQRLVIVAMPRIRDFRGASPRSFDGHGNFSFGIKECYIFPEIKYDKISDIFGMEVAVVTTAKTDAEGKSLLEGFGIPFRV